MPQAEGQDRSSTSQSSASSTLPRIGSHQTSHHTATPRWSPTASWASSELNVALTLSQVNLFFCALVSPCQGYLRAPKRKKAMMMCNISYPPYHFNDMHALRVRPKYKPIFPIQSGSGYPSSSGCCIPASGSSAAATCKQLHSYMPSAPTTCQKQMRQTQIIPYPMNPKNPTVSTASTSFALVTTSRLECSHKLVKRTCLICISRSPLATAVILMLDMMPTQEWRVLVLVANEFKLQLFQDISSAFQGFLGASHRHFAHRHLNDQMRSFV